MPENTVIEPLSKEWYEICTRFINVTAVPPFETSVNAGGYTLTPADVLDLYPPEILPDISRKRAVLQDRLNSRYGNSSINFDSELWNSIALFKKAVISMGFVKWKNFDANEYVSEENYKRCFWMFTKGLARVNPKDRELLEKDEREFILQKISCGQTFCLYCEERRRRKLALEKIDVFRQIVENNSGCPGLLQLVFTLPAEYEAVPLYDSDIEKKILNELHQFIRRLFGFSRSKKNLSNIAIQMTVHPVGSSMIFRDRWHVHVDILPAHISGSVGNKKFEWLYPHDAFCQSPFTMKNGRKHPGHTDKDWFLNLDKLRFEWSQILRNIFADPDIEAIQPEVRFFSYSSDSRQARRNAKFSKLPYHHETAFWRKIAHTIKYNLRSFAQDFEKVILRASNHHERFIVKFAFSYPLQFEGWLDIPAEKLVWRFDFIRSHTITRARGFIQCLGKYKDILGIEIRAPSLDWENFLTAPAHVFMKRELKYNKKTGRMELDADELFQFDCPKTFERRKIWRRSCQEEQSDYYDDR